MRLNVLAEQLGQTTHGVIRPLVLRVAELEAVGARAAITDAGILASLGDLGARLAVLETREPIPGPPGPEGPAGPEGPPGPHGRDGVDGKNAKWNYRDTYVTGKTYDVGDLVTDHGSLFYCARTTTGRPAASSDWKLIVKRGQDGKDAR